MVTAAVADALDGAIVLLVVLIAALFWWGHADKFGRCPRCGSRTINDNCDGCDESF